MSPIKGRLPFGERERRNSQTCERDMWVTKEIKSCSETELHAIKTAFCAIESLWRDVSMGTDSISVHVLKSIHQQLGEIGSEFFRRIFLSRGLMMKVNLGNIVGSFYIWFDSKKCLQLSKRDFWACWTIFMAEELFLQNHQELLDSDMMLDDMSESGFFMGDSVEEGLPPSVVAGDVESEDGFDDDPNCFEMIHSRFAPSRRLKPLLFSEDLAVSAC
jgi:hypothetical protein